MQTRKSLFLESVKTRLQDDSRLVTGDVSLSFVSRSTNVTEISDTVTSGMLTVLTDCLPSDHSFNEAVYNHHLNTRVLGNVILYADVTTTTMSLLQGSVLSSLQLHHHYQMIEHSIITIITSGQSNLTEDCIAAADGWLNRIRQVAPMCTPYIV